MKTFKITALAMSLGLLAHASAQDRTTTEAAQPSAIEGGRSASGAGTGGTATGHSVTGGGANTEASTANEAAADKVPARAGTVGDAQVQTEIEMEETDEARDNREAKVHPEDSGVHTGAPTGSEARGGRAASGAPGFSDGEDPAPVPSSPTGASTGAPTGSDARGGRAASPAPGTR